LLRPADGVAPGLGFSGISRVELLDQRKIVGVVAREPPDPGEPAYVHTRELETAGRLGADG
jgi:hypothetical protein